MKLKHFTIYFCLIFIIVLPVNSYKITPPENVHQHISNESQEVLLLIPYEVKKHLTNPINRDFGGSNYDIGDDIIDGSKEEDEPLFEVRFSKHFWQPDDPDTSMNGSDDYNDGLRLYDSSYRQALEYWRGEVINNYLSGNINESYYWLGRVAHLLEDASQPSHVHLDAHLPLDSSILEEWTADNFNNYKGSDYKDQSYEYKNLIENFTWSQVQPTRTPDNLHPEFFRLFWYTAQKTQYWASDDSDGNREYVALNGSTIYWDCGDSGGEFDLWEDEGLSCGDMITYSSELNETTVGDGVL